MKKNILLTMIFTIIITVSAVADAKKMLPTTAKPTNTESKFTVKDLQFTDRNDNKITGNPTKDTEVNQYAEDFVKAVNKVQDELATLKEFLTKKGFTELYNDPSKKLDKKSKQKAQALIQRINKLISNASEGIYYLRDFAANKGLYLNTWQIESGILRELENQNNRWNKNIDGK